MAKWPFFLGTNIYLLATAYFIGSQSKLTLGAPEIGFVLLCVSVPRLGVAPFVLEYQALVKVSEAGALNTVVAHTKNLEGTANQIGARTGKLQDAQARPDKTAVAARKIAE